VAQPQAAGAESAAPAQDSPAPDPQQTFDQVVLGLRGKFDPRAGKAEIRLDPPNLGTVRVSVSLDNGTLTADFQSSSDLVRGLLKDNMEKLKSILESRGVAVDRLAVGDSPRDAVAAPAAQQQSAFGDASHDGRSANQYQPDPRSANARRPADVPFAALFRKAAAAPVDLVA
jgi:flagellar hook-length control protein FliK